jgi:hypothetical protein
MMGLSWQQGPLGAKPAGRFLVAEPLPERLPFAGFTDPDGNTWTIQERGFGSA